MFDFLNPLFLWGAAAAAIPLILHLMQRRRVVRMPFSTLRFLKLADRKSSRRIRLENLLLLLLRTLTMLAVVCAFAMPMLRTRALSSVLERAERDIAIVLDASYSMNYRVGRESSWDKTVEAAIGLVEQLSEGDRVCVFLAGEDVRPVFEQLTADRAQVTAQLRKLQPEATPSRLAPAIRAARAALDEQSGRRERELHIITDGQALPWAAALAHGDATDGDRAPPEEKRAADRRTLTFVTLAGSQEPVNTAPVKVTVEPPLLTANGSARITASIGWTGPPRGTVATLYVDDREIARRTVDAAGDGSGRAVFTVPPLSPGTHAARVETPVDGLPDDDAFHFLIPVRDKLPCLCVGAREDTFYLVKALDAGEATSLAARRIDPPDVAGEALDGYVCVFLCNALPMPGQCVVALEQYVRNGGLVAVFPGSRASPGDYGAWQSLPVVPPAVTEFPPAARRKTLLWEAPRHPVLEALKPAAGAAPAVTVRQALDWTVDPASDTRLIGYGDGRAFLTERTFGAGKTVVFAVSADRAWSDFPLTPLFLPIVHQLVRYGSGITRRDPFVTVCPSLPLTDIVPASAAAPVLLYPDGGRVAVRGTRVENRPVYHAEALIVPGIYRQAIPGPTPPQPVLAVNLAREESDLTPVDRGALETLGPPGRVAVVDGRDELLRVVRDFRVGRTFAEQLLWLALVVGTVEVLWANRLSRRGTAPIQRVAIDAAGRVRQAR